MGYHEKISCHGVGPGLSLQKNHKQKAGQAAGSGIQESAGQAAQGEVVGDKGAWGDENQIPVVEYLPPLSGVEGGHGSRQKKGQGESQGYAVDDAAVVSCMYILIVFHKVLRKWFLVRNLFANSLPAFWKYLNYIFM